MKKIFFFLLSFGCMNVYSQILYEHTYDSAATYNFCSGSSSQLMMVDLEVSGQQYVNINRCGKTMKIYSLQHNLVKTIDLSHLPYDDPNTLGSILYISEKLFNTDSKLEYMYVSVNSFSTMIYNEDGQLLFSENGAPMVIMNVLLQQYPIYNTDFGTKMILSYTDGSAKVFGLAGKLAMPIEKTAHNLFLSNPYPNPSFQASKIDYELPTGVHEGELVFYDMLGKEIRSIKVDDSAKTIQLSTLGIASGTYLYQLRIKGNASGVKRMVVLN